MATKNALGRGPKYRTSCDSCQAMKIKCGQEKPSCRRCSTQRLECVYSLSRRMGRPREKRNISDETNRRNSHDTPPDDSLGATSLPTPVSSSTQIPTNTPCPNEPVLDVNPTIQQPFADAADDWPVGQHEADWEPSNYPDDLHQSELQSRTNSIDDLQTGSNAEMNSSANLPDLFCFLEDAISQFDAQSTQPSASVFDLIDVPFPSLPDLPSGRPPRDIAQTSIAAKPSNDAATSNNVTILAPTCLADITGNIDISDPTALKPTPSSISIAPEKDFWSSSGRSISEPNPISSQSLSVDCTCTTPILQSIESVKDAKKRRGPIPLDLVLTLESRSKDSISQLLICPSCRVDTSSHLMGLMSIRMVLDLLHRMVREEFITRKRASISALASSNSMNKQKKSSSDLYIGKFKVTSRVRYRFLYRTLQARFQKLSIMLSDWERLVNDGPADNAASKDCFMQAAAVLLKDVEKDLRIVVGWVELGNAKA